MMLENRKKKITKILMIISIFLVFFLSYNYVNERKEKALYFNNSSSADIYLNENLLLSTDNSEEVIEEKKELTLMFGGDIMLSRTVNAKMKAYDDYAWPARLIASTTEKADITIFNLESPFLKDSNYSVPTGSFSFKADPLAAETLKLLGADLVSLANNHMLNASKQGIVDTLDILAENNIHVAGAGLNEEGARKAAIIVRNNWRLGFLSYAYPNDYSVANETRAGIATMDLANLQEDIESLRDEVDIVVILMHAGIEYVSFPQSQQVSFAHSAIDFGADLVIGHHPHWPQTWEIYNDKAIFYSLGNFIFDQMWSKGTSQGLLAEIVFQPDMSAKANLIPIVIKDYGQVELWPQDREVADFWSVYGIKEETDISWGNNSSSK